MDPLIKHNVALQDYCSFKIGGTAANFAHITNRRELVEACDWARDHTVPIFILGEGSNLIFGDKAIQRLILKIEIQGYVLIEEDDESVTIKIGAGEHWDSVVARSVEDGLAGIESMSMIPGTAGATPVQNVGAYGQEIKDTLVELEAYDTKVQSFTVLSNAQCGFGYRSSIFNSTERGRYIICAVTLKLSKLPPKPPTYESLRAYLAEREITTPDLHQIRRAVMAVRAERLPDPSVVPNAGSFFGNPIVEAAVADDLLKNYPDVPTYPALDSKVKVAAGWLIEQSGFKGKTVGRLKIYDKHAQVLTNPNGASYHDLEKAVQEIRTGVYDKFGIQLQQEPEVVE